jgi:hypothetical protein
MVLAIRQTLLRLRLDSKTFFRMAHLKVFGRDVDCSGDALEFDNHAVVPRYVERYMAYLQGEMT